jgi:hypothetical protein
MPDNTDVSRAFQPPKRDPTPSGIVRRTVIRAADPPMTTPPWLWCQHCQAATALRHGPTCSKCGRKDLEPLTGDELSKRLAGANDRQQQIPWGKP